MEETIKVIDIIERKVSGTIAVGVGLPDKLTSIHIIVIKDINSVSRNLITNITSVNVNGVIENYQDDDSILFHHINNVTFIY